MTTEELRNYVYEQRRQGMDDKQIAAHLNISVEELAKLLNGKPSMKDAKLVKNEKPAKAAKPAGEKKPEKPAEKTPEQELTDISDAPEVVTAPFETTEQE